MSLRPIDFIGALFNLKRGEKFQSQKMHHNWAIQQSIGEETKKKIMEDMHKVVDTKQSGEMELSVKEKKRRGKEGKKKGRKEKYTLYGRGKSNMRQGYEGNIIDEEA